MARWFSPRLAPRKPSSSLCRAWTLYRPAAATFGWTPCRVVGGGRRGRCLHRTGYVLRLQMAARTPRRVVSRCRRRCQSCPGCGAGPRPARPGRAPSRLPRCPPTASPPAASGPCPWPSQPMGPVTPGCSSRRSPPCGADEPLEVLVLGHGRGTVNSLRLGGRPSAPGAEPARRKYGVMRYRPGSVPPFGLTAPRLGRAVGLGVEPHHVHHGRRPRPGQPRRHALSGTAQGLLAALRDDTFRWSGGTGYATARASP